MLACVWLVECRLSPRLFVGSGFEFWSCWGWSGLCDPLVSSTLCSLTCYSTSEKRLMPAAGPQGDAVPQGTDLAEGTQGCRVSARRRDGCVELESGNKSSFLYFMCFQADRD